jgi:membrane protein
VTILGSLLRGDPGLQQQILHSALWDFPIIGDQIGQNIHSLHGSVTAVIIGVIGSLYSGLGVTRAGHHRAIRVEHRSGRLRRHSQRTPTAPLSADAYGATLSGRLRRHPQRGPAGHRDLLAVLVNTALFIAAFRILTDQDVAIVQIRTGAIVAAIAWQALQELGT